jgi:NAD(P)H dehydrogenase (quinone)
MNHTSIVAHPKRNSFVMAISNAYQEAASGCGHNVIVRDLYRNNFDPCLREDELPWAKDFVTHPDVAAERKVLQDANVFALFYPLWLNAPPAMLKGYLERVFGYGFAYGRGRGGNEPLLRGRKLISFSSSGAPMDWIIHTGAWQAVRTLFDAHFAAVCGMEVVDHVHFGGIVPGIRADVVAKHFDTVRQKVTEHF